VELYSEAHAELSAHLIEVLGTAGHLLGIVFARRRGELKLSPLTARELEVLTLAAEGLTAREMAERLGVSERTITTHLGRIYGKLGVGSRLAAVRLAVRSGLVGAGNTD